MQMERGLDSGPVYRTLTMDLDGSEYADSLEMTLGQLAADNAVETLQAIADGTLPPVPQNPAEVTVCRKISKRDGYIDWNRPAFEIEAMTRAYFPWPGAVAQCRTAAGKVLNLSICSTQTQNASALAPGQSCAADGAILVGCGSGTALEIRELIPAGGKRMSAAAFLNGLRGEVPEFITGQEI